MVPKDRKIYTLFALIALGSLLVRELLLNRHNVILEIWFFPVDELWFLGMGLLVLTVIIVLAVQSLRRNSIRAKNGIQLKQNNLYQFGRVLLVFGSFGSVALARALGVRYTYDKISQSIYIAVMFVGTLVMYLGFEFQQIAYEPKESNPSTVKSINRFLDIFPAIWKSFWRDNNE